MTRSFPQFKRFGVAVLSLLFLLRSAGFPGDVARDIPCATCGMTGCGTVCCCSLEEGAYHCANEKLAVPGLFAAGCKEIQKTLQEPPKAVLNFVFLTATFLKTNFSIKPFQLESIVLAPRDPPPRVFS